MPDVFKSNMDAFSPKNEVAPGIINNEIYPNCPAQVIRNSVIGKVGVGWRKNGE